jgi:hypothetical protein
MNMNSKIIDHSFIFKSSRIIREVARSIDRNMKVEIKVMKTDDYIRQSKDV